MNHRNINSEFEELKNQIKLLEEENEKLKIEIRGYLISENELKAQITTERCMKRNY